MAWSPAARQAAAEARRKKGRRGRKLAGKTAVKTGGQRGRGTKKRGSVVRPKKVLRPGLKRNAYGKVVKDTNATRVAKRTTQSTKGIGAYKTAGAQKKRKMVGAKTPKRLGATGAMRRRKR